MPASARIILFGMGALVACGQTACNLAPRSHLRQSQHRSMQLYRQGQDLAAQNQQTQLEAQRLAAEKSQLQQEVASLQSAQSTLQQRIDNLQGERQELQQRYTNLVNRSKTEKSPLSDDTTRQLEDLKKKYPQFDFDPQTGVSKFNNDILFESGSAELRPSSMDLMRDFAQILCQGDAQRLNILVVGHTDDRPIAKASTKSKHGDNWDLSAHRAIHVTRALAKNGIKDGRMGVAGYGPFQPLVPNTNAESRQRNRRVEIFVLAPNASVAGWDQGNSGMK